MGYEESKSYKEVNIGNLYTTLIAHYIATIQLKGKPEAQEIYSNSILHEQKNFKYSSAKVDLEMLLEKNK